MRACVHVRVLAAWLPAWLGRQGQRVPPASPASPSACLTASLPRYPLPGWLGGWLAGWLAGWVGGWVGGRQVRERFLESIAFAVNDADTALACLRQVITRAHTSTHTRAHALTHGQSGTCPWLIIAVRHWALKQL